MTGLIAGGLVGDGFGGAAAAGASAAGAGASAVVVASALGNKIKSISDSPAASVRLRWTIDLSAPPGLAFTRSLAALSAKKVGGKQRASVVGY